LGQTNSPLKPQKNKKYAASIRARGVVFRRKISKNHFDTDPSIVV